MVDVANINVNETELRHAGIQFQEVTLSGQLDWDFQPERIVISESRKHVSVLYFLL